jgi:3-methylcrotonyl-CoA carboxylase alpha subunit
MSGAEAPSLVQCDDRLIEAVVDTAIEPAWTVRDGQVVLFEDGEAYAFSRPRAAAEASGAGGDGRIVAPMPGRITSMAVKAGDAAAKGQTLVTLEAMKMEHALVAPFEATVAEVRCAVGEQVTEGAMLLRLEPRG